MDSFLRYHLREKRGRRSIHRAMKLGGYLANRHDKAARNVEDPDDMRLSGSIDFRKASLADWEKVMVFVGGTNSSDFTDQPIQAISTKKLIPIQTGSYFIPGDTAKRKLKDKEPLHVVRMGGKLYIVDGHHRYMAALLRRKPYVPCHIHNFDN